ncbi:MliC family protein [Brevundimonas sp.]|uniref:MliC family protein n=1 Tax=Brevundimonas sp. TaxID=1871086 RepID=UPI00263805FD|nr:MliC family protein [Brevundimonas sp.]
MTDSKTRRRWTTGPLVPGLALALGLAACGGETPVTDDSDAVRDRALEADVAKGQTGAEVQERSLTRTVRTVYICDDGERLSVEFDNPREMATVRTSLGQAFDLYLERAPEGIWYRSSGHELRGQGQLATWTSEGMAPTDCRAVG